MSEFSSGGTPTYTKTGATIGADLTTLWSAVETPGSGLLDKMSAAEGDIDDLEGIATEVGTPTMAVASTLTTGATDSELLWTAKTKGQDGDDLSVQTAFGCMITPTAELRRT